MNKYFDNQAPFLQLAIHTALLSAYTILEKNGAQKTLPISTKSHHKSSACLRGTAFTCIEEPITQQDLGVRYALLSSNGVDTHIT